MKNVRIKHPRTALGEVRLKLADAHQRNRDLMNKQHEADKTFATQVDWLDGQIRDLKRSNVELDKTNTELRTALAARHKQVDDMMTGRTGHRFVQVRGADALFNAGPYIAAMGTPVPMLLWCPSCGERHVDVGEFATKEHHTHACQGCGMVWRPAIVATVGVQYLPGFKNLPVL